MIDLPDTPGPVDLTWRHIDYGGRLTPPLGGEVQRVNRLGNRLALTVTLPPMTPRDAAAWIVALNIGLTEGVRWRVRQVELEIGVPGLPTVDGSDSAGATLKIKGATAGYPVRMQQFLTVCAAEGRTLHMARVLAVVASNGKATLALVPPLRLELADGDAVLIGAPTIEGLLDGEGFEWTIGRARRIGLSFTIIEQR